MTIKNLPAALVGLLLGLLLHKLPQKNSAPTVAGNAGPGSAVVTASRDIAPEPHTFSWHERSRIRDLPNSQSRQSAYAKAIWTEARGSLTQCLTLLRLLPFSDQRGTEQLLAAQMESLPDSRLDEEMLQLIQWDGTEGEFLLGTGASLIAARNPGKIRSLVDSIHSSSNPNSKFRLSLALLDIPSAGLEHANDALKLTENTKHFGSALLHTAHLVSGDPSMVRSLFSDKVEGATHTTTQLRSACLPFARGIPISEKISMLALIDSDETRQSTARRVGRFAELRMDDLRSASQSTQPEAVMVASGMLGPAWDANPAETSTILNEIPDSATRTKLWDDLLRSWRDCRTREDVSARLASSVQGLSKETQESLTHAMDRIYPPKPTK